MKQRWTQGLTICYIGRLKFWRTWKPYLHANTYRFTLHTCDHSCFQLQKKRKADKQHTNKAWLLFVERKNLFIGLRGNSYADVFVAN